jgi:outer membrane protein assembly factor BamD (BamD/ComL family)
MHLRLLPIVVLACSTLVSGEDAGAWKLRQWEYRKTLRIIPESVKTPLKYALQGGLAADFTVAVDREKADPTIDVAQNYLAVDGKCKPDGSDIRIFDGRGQEVPYQVINAIPERVVLLLFQVKDPQSDYIVYYGNADAPKPDHWGKWEAKRGLYLETRACPPGKPRSLQEMKALVANSKVSYGVQYNMWIFNHYNPMGPVDRYLYVYRGWLEVPETGQYSVGTTSDGPSFFVIDGKLAVEKTNDQPANREVPDVKPLQLTKGVHQVEYYAGGPDGPFRAVATWKPPSSGQMDVIKYEHFPRVLSAESVAVERRGAPFALDFSTKVLESIPLEDIQANSYKFTSKCHRKAAKGGKLSYSWEFGDGATSTEESPVHVFFEVGHYDVKFRASDATGHTEEIKRTVFIEDFNTVDHERQHVIDALQTGALHLEHHHSKVFLEVPPSEIERMGKEFLKIVGAYNALQVILPTLKGMVQLFKRMEETAKLVEASEALLKRFPNGPQEMVAGVCLALADAYLDKIHQAADARRVLETLLTLKDKLSQETLKVAYLRLGRLYLSENELDKAKEAYEKAEGLRTKRQRWQVEQMQIGAHEIAAVAALNEKKFAAARETLEDWEREFPKDVLRGRTMFLRGKSHFLEQAYDSAIVEFDRSLAANPFSPWAPECCLLLGQAHIEKKAYKEAREALQKIVDSFPKSRFADEAGKLLNKIKKKT